MALDIKQLIQDKSGDRDYFAMVPGLLWPDIKLCSGSSTVEPLPVHIQEIGIELNVHDKWLYASLKKICGETGGQCFLSTRGLAKFAGMSTGQTSKSKAKLEEVGLIEIVCKKRSVKGQAIDHITVVDVWEENIKVMKARKESVHLVNALREKQERSQKGAKRSSDEHLSSERSPSEDKCSPCETEEEPIEEEPRNEEEKEEEPLLFPEKPEPAPSPGGDGADSGQEGGDVDDHSGHIGHGIVRDTGAALGESDRAVEDHQSEIAPDFDAGTDAYWQHLREAEANQKADGNYAVPTQAGGSYAVSDAALFALYSVRGKKPPRKSSREWENQRARVIWALESYGYQKAELKLVEKAAEIFCERKGDWTNVYYPSFAMDFGQALSDAEYFLEHGCLPDDKKGAKHGDAHQRNRGRIAQGAVRRQVASEKEARAILGDRYSAS